MFVPMLAAAVLQAASTPQRAAIGAMYSDPKKPPVVRRVNVAGSYAAVLTSGGRIEGELVTVPILVERFSFGWQALDLLSLRCRLGSRELGQRVDVALTAGMPQPADDRPCRGYRADAGPTADVEAVRRLMGGPLVPYVRVAGDWALGEWYGAGGGEALYRKNNGRWQLVENGGGALDVGYMRRYGVPQSAWCELGIFDAKCR